MIKSAAEGFAGKSAADSIPLTSCPCRCRDPRCVCNGNIPAKYRRSQRTAFPLPLHWAASKTARVRHLAASVACLWQTANVINGFITQSHKRRAAHSWQEARHVETERHITTSVVTNYDTDRSQTAAGEPGTFSYQQVTPPRLLMPFYYKSTSGLNHSSQWQAGGGCSQPEHERSFIPPRKRERKVACKKNKKAF